MSFVPVKSAETKPMRWCCRCGSCW
jgi:hypothetical protein